MSRVELVFALYKRHISLKYKSTRNTAGRELVSFIYLLPLVGAGVLRNKLSG